MKIHLKSETEVELFNLHEDGFDITSDDPEVRFGSIQMFMASIALCTFSVLASYGARCGAGAEDITIHLKWTYSERPYRISTIDMTIHWPQLPESRLDAATRAAHHCTLHNSLQHSVQMGTLVEN